jgi:hypothetical protein
MFRLTRLGRWKLRKVKRRVHWRTWEAMLAGIALADVAVAARLREYSALVLLAVILMQIRRYWMYRSGVEKLLDRIGRTLSKQVEGE